MVSLCSYVLHCLPRQCFFSMSNSFGLLILTESPPTHCRSQHSMPFIHTLMTPYFCSQSSCPSSRPFLARSISLRGISNSLRMLNNCCGPLVLSQSLQSQPDPLPSFSPYSIALDFLDEKLGLRIPTSGLSIPRKAKDNVEMILGNYARLRRGHGARWVYARTSSVNCADGCPIEETTRQSVLCN